MSITFSIEGAVSGIRKCEDCDCTVESEMCMVALPPYLEINMANGNAYAFLESLNLDMDYCGTIEVADLDAVQSQIENLKRRNSLTVPEYRVDNIVICGRDEEYVAIRLSQFTEMIRVAKELGRKVFWC